MCCARTAVLQVRRRMLGRTTSFLQQFKQQFKRNPQEIQAKCAGVRHSWHDMRMSCPRMPQEPPRGVQNRPSEGSKSILGGFKIKPRSPWGPGELQERRKSALRTPEERPKSAQERPREPQERPRTPTECPKSIPRATQERPKNAQEGPRRSFKTSRELSETVLTPTS